MEKYDTMLEQIIIKTYGFHRRVQACVDADGDYIKENEITIQVNKYPYLFHMVKSMTSEVRDEVPGGRLAVCLRTP